MIRNVILCSNTSGRNKLSNIINYAKFSTGATLNEKWDLLSAICLERKPVITAELTEIEKDFKKLLSDIELERSLKSDFELKNELEQKQLQLLKEGGSEELDAALKHTAQDFFDAATEELNQFKVAPRITSADKSNDQKSLKRKLDRHLVFVTNQTVGGKKHFLLPQTHRQDGETLRQAADRLLKETVPDIKAQIYGNAPSAFYKYKYPESVRKEKGVEGAKVFIYFARYLSGQAAQKIEYRWLDRKELQELLPPAYFKDTLRQMLIDE